MTQPKNDTLSIVDDKRIDNVEEIITPKELIKLFPLDNVTAKFVEDSRIKISDIINLKDIKTKPLVIVGPCSIHNHKEALEYAKKVKEWREKYPQLEIIMRVYFEKPRTTVGWKGSVNDPDLDESFNIDKGLKLARELLLKINQLGVPCATEFLDPVTPQYIADLISWGAIGARTVESQTHRQLASGLSMPIGFKNGTKGDPQVAIDAIKAGEKSHSFLSVTKNGKAARITTSGNPDGHFIARGGTKPNYSEEDIEKIEALQKKHGIHKGIIVDFSHANSGKKWENQIEVCKEVSRQILEGNRKIAGVMIEGYFKGGSQSYTPGENAPNDIQEWLSITDECTPIDGEKGTESMLEMLNSASSIRLQSA
ncbi:3-deoxy-7-phosphoheptulonate synthase [Candidatus Gracilibacteria bacterium]|nr:3-deoxy-7-phosphoheptulonate synthase [Candidatus Gracilibacteria bacterium]NUJ98549.1 3-deoxy-7-phosphoheptulonate synthase [Candidatus Gracilibacteria bacterium]